MPRKKADQAVENLTEDSAASHEAVEEGVQEPKPKNQSQKEPFRPIRFS